MACSQALLFRKILKITEPLPVQTAILVSYVPRGRALGLSRWTEGGKILSSSTQTAPHPLGRFDTHPKWPSTISTEYLAVRNTRRSISTIKHNALSSVYGWTMPKKRIEIFEFNHCTSLELSSRFVHFFFPSMYKYSIYYPVLIFFEEKRAGKKNITFFFVLSDC